MEKKIIVAAMTVFLLVAMAVLSKKAAVYTSSTEKKEKKTVVIDAGHGGNDPGKVSADQVLEKDINLQIAKRLEALLKQSDIRVIMTRNSDMGLYDENATNKKAQDMKRRISVMEENKADLVISIHQNSFRDSRACGPQCFYYAHSAEGAKGAGILQNTLNEGLSIEAPRQEKANDSYYILKKSAIPTVIVECGFLSNPTELGLLQDEDYQEKLSFQIYMGIQRYFNEI